MDFLDELWAYLATGEPLPACRFCLGTVGKARPQSQVPEAGWAGNYDLPTEELIDMEVLRAAERGEDLDLEHHVVRKSGPKGTDRNTEQGFRGLRPH